MIPLGLWHCFGADDTVRVDMRTVLAMLKASGTRLLPINTHAGDLRLGHGDAMYADLVPHMFELGLTPCLNINRRTSAAQAIRAALQAREQSGIQLLKLEVLNDDMATSNDRACVQATEALGEEGFTVMPLITADPDAAAEIVWNASVEVLRVMGSPIGSGLGIQNTFRAGVCAETAGLARIPSVLDGGIGSPRDTEIALEIGFHGVLVNSCLFKHPEGPLCSLRNHAAAFERVPA